MENILRFERPSQPTWPLLVVPAKETLASIARARDSVSADFKAPVKCRTCFDLYFVKDEASGRSKRCQDCEPEITEENENEQSSLDRLAALGEEGEDEQ